ncbi:hypothetical protein [Foetidibacter luteolus]|uniref:hypothetical protein n=1 Tax=Foetidibacter luteolus TaxID=2608880 RepID=UPI00129BB7AA|nr:hypothetical protein [Foetidibacter luteolus]
MKNQSIRQEILLMINTSFTQRQWCQKNEIPGSRPLSKAEQLEDACWNGMLYEMLPGLVETSAAGKKLFLWQMKQNKECLEMELGECPGQVDYMFSIDPHYFLAGKICN